MAYNVCNKCGKKYYHNECYIQDELGRLVGLKLTPCCHTRATLVIEDKDEDKVAMKLFQKLEND